MAYPKKELKKRSSEIWHSKNLDYKLPEILAFIANAKLTDRWSSGYVKQPPAFLNGECWNDDLASYGGAKKGGFTPYVAKNDDGSRGMDYSKKVIVIKD